MYYQQNPAFNGKTQILMATYIKLPSRGKDFQLAASMGEIATDIWDTVFPTSEQGTKTTLLSNINSYLI